MEKLYHPEDKRSAYGSRGLIQVFCEVRPSALAPIIILEKQKKPEIICETSGFI